MQKHEMALCVCVEMGREEWEGVVGGGGGVRPIMRRTRLYSRYANSGNSTHTHTHTHDGHFAIPASYLVQLVAIISPHGTPGHLV